VIDLADEKRKSAVVTSRKRRQQFGNAGSDHSMGQGYSDAIDLGLVNDQEFMDMTARHIGGPSDVADYQHFIVRNPWNGNQYRAQLIAVTHGTGPHFRAGIQAAVIAELDAIDRSRAGGSGGSDPEPARVDRP
jgi:hypothetical protein